MWEAPAVVVKAVIEMDTKPRYVLQRQNASNLRWRTRGARIGHRARNAMLVIRVDILLPDEKFLVAHLRGGHCINRICITETLPDRSREGLREVLGEITTVL